jgi:CheY-like chemotaxis protein
MPGMDGFMLLDKIRADKSSEASAIMMLTSGDQADDSQRCRELGVSEYAIKPVSQPELLRMALKALDGASAHQTPISSPTVSPVRPASRPLRILLAEDNIFNQRVAVGMLEKMGHAVTVTSNGREAVEEYAKSRFELVLMDIQMPEMDGPTATRHIRQQQQQSGRRVPVVAMTAHAMSGDREKYLAAGLDDYISKPISRDELAKAVERNSAAPASNGHGENGHSHEPTIPTTSSSPETLRIDADAVLLRCGGDHDLMGTLVGMFPGELRKLLSTLEQARSAGDVHGVQINAHTIKGMCGMFEAKQAAGAALELEKAAGAGHLGTDQQFEVLRIELSRAMEAVTQLQPQH